MTKVLIALLTCLTTIVSPDRLWAEQWSIPFGGNSYCTSPDVESRALQPNGLLSWSDPAEVHSIYFHVDRPATLDVSLKGHVSEGTSTIIVGGPQLDALKLTMTTSQPALHSLGKIKCDGPLYLRLDIQGSQRSGPVFAELQELIVQSDTAELEVDYVRNNKGNMFYWGKRGPSVHLSYKVPTDVAVQYAYSELAVPPGLDPIGSYYMANGFAEGYFGMQVNGVEERRILFSVWSPFNTDNPRDIPKDKRVVLLSKGPDTHTGEFGNEGSGGQSYVIYPWKAGVTYRFLTEVRPDQDNKTIYTCWFSPKTEDWQLIASFIRPETNTHLRGFHSFLESFDPNRGHIERRCSYSNIWVVDTSGKWHACQQAKFSVDPTGAERHRLDFEGGVDNDHFWLRNCGFFSGKVKAGTTFTSTARSLQNPTIDFATLPR